MAIVEATMGRESKNKGVFMSEKKDVEKVISAYSKQVNHWQAKDPRDSWAYILSKMQADYALISKIDLTDREVLNIGCSFPIDEIYFSRKVKKWTAVDLNPKVLKFARKIINRELSPMFAERIIFIPADASQLPFDTESFDIVVSFSTIDHIPGSENRRRVIYEMSRVTKKEGYVIVTVPNRLNVPYYRGSQKLQKAGMASFGYEYSFTPWELKRLLISAGLHPISFSSTLNLDGMGGGLIGAVLKRFAREVLQYLGRRMGYLAKK